MIRVESNANYKSDIGGLSVMKPNLGVSNARPLALSVGDTNLVRQLHKLRLNRVRLLGLPYQTLHAAFNKTLCCLHLLVRLELLLSAELLTISEVKRHKLFLDTLPAARGTLLLFL